MTGAREDARGLRLVLCTDTYAPQVNGVTRTLQRLVAAIRDRGGEVRVETVDDPGAHADVVVSRWPSIPFWAYPQLRMAAPRRRALLDRIAGWRPTLVHAATPFGVGLAGRGAARSLRIPFVTSYHTSYAAYLRHYGLGLLEHIAWPFLRWFHNSGRRTFAPSRAVADQLSRQGVADVRVWSRGVDLEQFNPRFRSDAFRATLGAGPDDCVVAYVGRLAPEKGVHTMLRALTDLPEQQRVRIAVAGDGPDDARCREIAPPNTWFAGSLSGTALSTFYASADLLVFPSTTETFGNVVLEAMASGVPVIAPDIGATLEVAHAATAQLFRGGDEASLRDAVRSVIADPSARARLRSAGLELAASRNWDAVWDGLVREYRAA